MFRVFDTLTINASSGVVQSLATMLGTTHWPLVDDRLTVNKRQIVGIELADHSASFYYSDTLAHTDKITQAAYEPLYLEGDARLIANTYVRAVADAAITGATLKIFYASQHRS